MGPICLPDPAQDYDNVKALVTGWGDLQYGGQRPDFLQEVNVTTMTNQQCRQQKHNSRSITDSMICAEGEAGRDACAGFDGSPLSVEGQDGRYSQIGVVSWGVGCGQPGYPGVYTRLSSLLDSSGLSGLRVFALNVWGLTNVQDKGLRMAAIGDFVEKAEYDLYLFSELWMRHDHETIRRKIPEGYFMTWYGDLTSSSCEGRALPMYCSGLAIVSKFPFIEKEFLGFSYRGYANFDGEVWAGKGAGESYWPGAGG